MAIISDDLKHDTVAVYEYQKIILNYLKSKFEVQKVYYVSDGARQHFKNKSSFANLIAHEKDFGIPAEWHFHPTAHGKGACDGIGANLKRNAAKYSLQCSHQNRILDATALFNWAKNFCKETEIVLQNPARIQGVILFFVFIVLAQVFLVLKKKQFEKVQLAEMS